MLISKPTEVKVYTVELTDDQGVEQNLFGNYILHLNALGNSPERIIMQAWITNIRRSGTKLLVLRHEGAAFAIPPTKAAGKQPIGSNITYLLEALVGLPAPRLYLAELGDAVVFFGGGLKTTQKAQDCPNVSQHFTLANRICRTFDRLLNEGDIQIDRYGELIIPEGFEFDIGP